MYLWYKEVIELNTYRTTEVATAIGIHPNTVRLYEELGLIPTPERETEFLQNFTFNNFYWLGLLFKSKYFKAV